MSRILIDTSAYAAFMRGNDEVVSVLRATDEIHVTATVLGELLAGFMSGGRRAKNESELARFLDSPRVHLVDVDEETAQRYAVVFTALRGAGTPVPTNDVWIAASAMQHGLRVLTLDKHFTRVPQILTQLVRA